MREGLKWSPRSRGLEDDSGVASRVYWRLVAGVFSSLVQLHGCRHGVGGVLDLTRVVVLPRKENLRGPGGIKDECTGMITMTEGETEAGWGSENIKGLRDSTRVVGAKGFVVPVGQRTTEVRYQLTL